MTLVVIDTNVIVYRYDARDDTKRRTAASLLRHLSQTGMGLLPVQCLAELSSVALNKLPTRWTPDELSDALLRLRTAFDVLPLTSAVVLEAIRGVRDHQMSYYDAQVWAAARLGQADIVVSEDFNDGSTLDGIAFINPFTDAGQALLITQAAWEGP